MSFTRGYKGIGTRLRLSWQDKSFVAHPLIGRNGSAMPSERDSPEAGAKFASSQS